MASAVVAKDRPAPDYFLEAIIATEVAQAIALNCPVLSVDPVAAQNLSEVVLDRLVEDGFDMADPTAEMAEPADDLLAMQSAFMEKHQLSGATSPQVCAAGQQEIAEATDIGQLLVEVAQ